MRIFKQKPKTAQQVMPVKSPAQAREHFRQSRELTSHLHLQRATGNQSLQRLLQNKIEDIEGSSPVSALGSFAHDFSREPVHHSPPENVQAKLTVSSPGDIAEQEADRVAEQVMRTPEPRLQRACSCGGGCPRCRRDQIDQEPLRMKRVQPGNTGQFAAPPIVHEVLAAPGHPIDSASREFMEPRFGQNFGHVRVHTDAQAEEATRSVGALAFTVGNNIVFGRAAFALHTESGRRLLAHELAHVAQAHPGVLQRTPGVDAEDSWRAMAADELVVEPNEPQRRTQAQEAVRRFLRVPVAQQMVNGLYNRFCTQQGCRLRIRTAFVERLGSAGRFSPETPVPRSGSQTYQVSVMQRDPQSRATTLTSTWGGGEFILSETYEDRVSYLASGLHHEVTHVWFVNTHPSAQHQTGHGIPERGEIDPRFFHRLQTFASQLQGLQGVLREEQQRARTAAEEAQRRRRPPEPSPIPAFEPEEPAAGPRIGGSAFVSGGVAFGTPGGPRFSSQFGGSVELLLAQIHALRIGPRGVYLTPNHLLLGGALGYRMRSDTGPLFFDIEAGLLQEVTPESAERLTRSVTGLMSAGFGGEHGSGSTRFVWQVGGFVLIHDRSGGLGVGASGGPAASLGVRY